ncbi:hypothetical protein M3Y95_00950600 [Aphelenchoides besseyi]|nr:hypothetical protein M3Y95_00950600 [Aphelenchoides besseyi]
MGDNQYEPLQNLGAQAPLAAPANPPPAPVSQPPPPPAGAENQYEVPNFPVSPAAPPPISPAPPVVQATTPQPTQQLSQPLPNTPAGEAEQSTNLMSTKPQPTQAATTQNLTVNQAPALDDQSAQKTVVDDEKAKAEGMASNSEINSPSFSAELARLKAQGLCGRYHGCQCCALWSCCVFLFIFAFVFTGAAIGAFVTDLNFIDDLFGAIGGGSKSGQQ